jgi:uncharacterized protein (TIGR03382 family)
MDRRIFLLKRIALLTALVAPAVVLANPIWTSDFESGDLSAWTGTQAVSADRLQIVSDPVREGSKALKVTVNHGDDPINCGNDRAEMLNMSYEAVGSEYFYRFSVMFPNDYPSHPKWQLFSQWHQTGLNGSPPVEMYVAGEQIRFRAGGEEELWKGPLQRGQWIDFVLHIRWSDDPKQGFVELYRDGQVVLPKMARATQLPGQLNYMKMGLYRAREIQATGTIYFDNIAMATQLEDVLPPSQDQGQPSDPGGSVDNTTSGATGQDYAATDGEYGANGGAGCSASGAMMPAAVAFAVLMLAGLLRRRRAQAVPVRARR